MLSRRRRQATTDNAAPAPEPSPEDVEAFNQNLKTHEGILHSTLTSIMNSPFMPTREQVIQLMTTMLTLLLMMALGPVVGANAVMVQAIVRQIVPVLVAAGVQYAADSALPDKSADVDITSVQLSPVPAQPSAFSSI